MARDGVDVSHVAHVRKIMEQLGMPIHNENFARTPDRWLLYLQSYVNDYNPESDLGTTFELKHKGGDKYDSAMVVQTGIPYRAVCAHHLLPVLGTAHVGYIPRDKVVGISKLARLVYGITHTLPGLQEDVCNQITHELMTYLKPYGAMCVISAEHGCMSARGVEEATGTVRTSTSSIKGVFTEDSQTRAEFYHQVAMDR